MAATLRSAVVVGAGVGGLAAALALARAGLHVTVLEAEPEPASPPTGLALWPNAMRALAMLGLGEDIRSRGTPIELGAVQRWDGRVLSKAGLSASRHLRGLGVCVRQSDLLDALGSALGDGFVHTGRRVTGFELVGPAVEVVLEGGARVAAEVLVGADGLHSVIRRGLIRDEARPLDFVAWRGLASVSLPGGVAVGRRAHVGWLPVGENLTYWFCCRAGRVSHEVGDLRSELLELFGKWWEPVPALIQATASREIRRDDLYDRAPAAGWGTGPVTLLGNAAHPMPPAWGQETGCALEDAAVLGGYLARLGDSRGALRLYERSRIERATRIQRAALTSFRLLQPRSWPGELARDLVLRLPTPWLARRQAWMFEFQPFLGEARASRSA